MVTRKLINKGCFPHVLYCLTDAEWDFRAPEPVPALELRGAAEDVARVAAEDSAELAPVTAGLRLHHAVRDGRGLAQLTLRPRLAEE